MTRFPSLRHRPNPRTPLNHHSSTKIPVLRFFAGPSNNPRRMSRRRKSRRTAFWDYWRAKRADRAALCTTTGSLTTSPRRAVSRTRSKTPTSQSSWSSPTMPCSLQTQTFLRGAASARWAHSESPRRNRVARVRMGLFRKVLRVGERGRRVARSLQLCEVLLM